MSFHLMLAATLLCTVAAGPLLAAEGGVKFVTLSSGGLAEVTRVHSVDGDETVRIAVTAEQVDDILKSLLVRDPGGSVGALSLDGPAQAEETFRRMPFAADDLSSPARLVGKLQGVKIKVTSSGRKLEGKVLGVSERNAGTEKGAVRVLSLLTDAGEVDSVALDDGATVAIQDREMVDKVAEAVAAAGKGKADGARSVEIRLTGKGKREIRVSYVVAAPVWKTAYRIVDGGGGKARLQAWAVIENAMGEDWKGVNVTLSSGAPVTLRQRLHQRYWRNRPEAPVAIEGGGMPDLDQGTVAPKAERQAARFRGGNLESPAPMAAGTLARAAPITAADDARMSYEAAPATQAAAASEGDISASFVLPHPVDLQAGRTLSVPIVDTEIDAERISLWKQGQGVHPIAALMIRNGSDATLPPGIITVYDGKAGYVGDARLPSTPVGEQRMASFATDRKVSVQAESEPREALARITVVDGVARATVTSREVTTYTVKGAQDGERTVVIEHPRRDGWTFASTAKDSETPGAYRLKVKVPAGGSAEVVATLERVQVDAYTLADADEATLANWATTATDTKLAAKLSQLSKTRAEVATVEREIEEIGQNEERIRSEQDRIRSNLAAVPKDSELARRYLSRMTAQEEELTSANTARVAAEKRLKALQAKVREAIAGF